MDPSGLIDSLHRQPVLAVLRPQSAQQAHRELEQLLAVGLVHVELAVGQQHHRLPAWTAMARRLCEAFPGLRLGAASVRRAEGLAAAVAAGLHYVVSPILDPRLLEQAQGAGLTLVPGVFSPTEVDAAVRYGCGAVKLYPASALGCGYWPSLQGPLGPLPFCIAAGGLRCGDVLPWLEAGVDAVALGHGLFDVRGQQPLLDAGLAPLLAQLPQGDNGAVLST
ncbi:bifunctional 4-hydroxy-2-oxoglutarate aldolase/2-dehydro-3-deoxy-phosphogluconate aldolase [Synechococcus sp. JJ3a-Johnson]|uniref:bifunctional 4-hydroxy-2-oxoglutarate aldolase/2-dehydro-3-deoxy-phosphogluconate aldolase n=1 Tax=Synechococcus sp. JJ3a-Johnson TaxID=2823738 RepID=UPI0020CC0A62|nr:bifunctional 4-hydroxy-2-oxoglutarate aldolase/2-dehydro-3-deoxy-phosphogluconate aldolase [Synechococcus sp. JJ3a-Johnson]